MPATATARIRREVQEHLAAQGTLNRWELVNTVERELRWDGIVGLRSQVLATLSQMTQDGEILRGRGGVMSINKHSYAPTHTPLHI